MQSVSILEKWRSKQKENTKYWRKTRADRDVCSMRCTVSKSEDETIKMTNVYRRESQPLR